MTDALVATSRDVLHTHARSFTWASWFLPPECRDDGAVIYALCRLIDDLVDESDDAAAANRYLGDLVAELADERPARPLVSSARTILGRGPMGVVPVLDLIQGVGSDLSTVAMADDAVLLRYCYRVAGTVGLMMCAVLDVRDSSALPFAIDLGVAMQITNICRDVAEDRDLGRVYLPEARLVRAGTSQAELLDGRASPARVAAVVLDLLALADRYYDSAERGMHFIPLRSRLAIVVAARVYRAIGQRLRARGGDALAGRVYVPWWGKVASTATALVGVARLTRARHDPGLHLALRGLPGIGHY